MLKSDFESNSFVDTSVNPNRVVASGTRTLSRTGGGFQPIRPLFGSDQGTQFNRGNGDYQAKERAAATGDKETVLRERTEGGQRLPIQPFGQHNTRTTVRPGDQKFNLNGLRPARAFHGQRRRDHPMRSGPVAEDPTSNVSREVW